MNKKFVNFLAIFLVLGAVSTLVLYYFDVFRPSSSRLAADFELPDSSGKTHKLSQYNDDWILVHFWASWCAPCIEEFPALLELMRRYEGKNIRLISVSLDTNWEEAKRAYEQLKETPSNWVSLIDLEAKTGERFGTFQLPETYLLGQKLEIKRKWVGAQKWSTPEAYSVFDQLSARPTGHR